MLEGRGNSNPNHMHDISHMYQYDSAHTPALTRDGILQQTRLTVMEKLLLRSLSTYVFA